MFVFRVLGFHSASFGAFRSLKYQNSLRSESSWVLGIPWDVDTDGLRKYIGIFGDLEDCIVMKEEMRAPAKKVARIFMVRIPPSVPEAAFRRTKARRNIMGLGSSLLLVQDPRKAGQRGFGFVTFAEEFVADRVS